MRRIHRTLLAAGLAPCLLLPLATAAIAEEEATRPPDASLPTPKIPHPGVAVIDNELAIGGEDVEARKRRSRMTVQVHVNGQGPYQFVVDSGADTSVVGSKLAARIGLPKGRDARLVGITESRVVERVLVDELRLGDSIAYDLELPALDEGNLGGDGMIGLDALVRQQLLMDFEKRVITIGDGDEPIFDMDGAIIVRGRLRKGQLILTQVKAQGQDIEAVVDTGSEITIGNSALRERLRKRLGDKFAKVLVTGVTGATIEMETVVIPRLKIGPITLENVPVGFADVAPFDAFDMAKRPSLLLGTDVMANFRRISLDFKDRKVRFQLRNCARAAVTIRNLKIPSLIATDDERACKR